MCTSMKLVQNQEYVFLSKFSIKHMVAELFDQMTCSTASVLKDFRRREHKRHGPAIESL